MSDPTLTLTKEGTDALDVLLHCTQAKQVLPATFFLVTNAEGEMYSKQAGDRVYGNKAKGEVSEDTVMELWSQTKLITSLAALQLVDAGHIKLDSASDVERYLPEIASLKVLTWSKDGELEEVARKEPITLEMLLSHSAGFTEDHPLMKEWDKQNSTKPSWDRDATIESLMRPLVFQPGTSWSYSPSMTLVGKLIERVSGQRLDEYFQDKIFSPLGITSMSFFPTDGLKANKMAVCEREKDGSFIVAHGEVAYGRSMKVDDIPTHLLCGGSGLFGSQKDYLTILRAILRSNPACSYSANTPLVSAQSFHQLFNGCIPLENRTALAWMVDPIMGAEDSDHSVGFSISLADLPGRRKAGSGYWAGAAKTMFWINPQSGIAGICATQLVSPGDKEWFALVEQFEETVYAHLKPSAEGTE